MVRRKDKVIGREIKASVACPRCNFISDHRDKTMVHAEALHGDYSSLRTRNEYLEFLKDRGYTLEQLAVAKLIPRQKFLTKTALRTMVRKGQA